jgi:hypothetical protein
MWWAYLALGSLDNWRSGMTKRHAGNHDVVRRPETRPHPSFGGAGLLRVERNHKGDDIRETRVASGKSSESTALENKEPQERVLGEIITVLSRDLDRLFKRMLSSANCGTFTESDASYARALIRAFFALVEGTCNALKVQALGDMLDDEERDIDSGIVSVVFEERFDLDDHGEVVVRPFTYTMQKNIKFAFRLYSEASNHPNTLNTSASWWGALVEMSRVRDRLMHPKRPEDLDVAPHDVVRCAEAGHGFHEAVVALMTGRR